MRKDLCIYPRCDGMEKVEDQPNFIDLKNLTYSSRLFTAKNTTNNAKRYLSVLCCKKGNSKNNKKYPKWFDVFLSV